MIFRNDEKNAFLLSGGNYSYAMYVTESGFLQHLHYGEPLCAQDVDFLIENRKRFSPKSDDFNMDIAFQNMPSEYGFYAHGDYREPVAILQRENGGVASRFRYASYQIKSGAPDLPGMPHVRVADETLIITLKDDFSPIEIDLYYTVCNDSPVLTRHAVIRNVGKENVRLKKAFSFGVDLPHGNYSALRLCGSWAKERMPVLAPIEEGITRIQSLRGATSHQTNCFMGVLENDCKEETGVCYGVELCYSGSFAITAEYSVENGLRLQGGVADVGFDWFLGGGEAFTTPQAFLCYSNEGVGGMSRGYADFLRERVIAPDCAYKTRPIVVNNWEATYFDFTKEKLFSIIDEAAKIGVDTFVLDDGWFGNRNSDNAGLGDWTVNEEKLVGGLDAIISRCKQKGLKFGLWFEPEMINEDSELYRSHPDYAVVEPNVEPGRSRNQLVLDFTRKEVVDYVYNAVSSILRAHEISYVKWDMNRNITECYSSSLLGDRQGEFMHRYILGVYDLAERLTKEFPSVFFEGCAGGGGRFDAGMLYYFSQIWTSDDTDAYERTKIQWGTSIAYPLSAMSCHVSVCPNHQTGRITPFATRGNIASLGATGYELDLSKMSQEEKEKAKKQIERYKAVRDLILRGDLYRISNPFEEDLFCEMAVSKDKSKAYVVGEWLRAVPGLFVHKVKLYGLAAEKTYHVEELNLTASGNALQEGIYLDRMYEYDSFSWTIREV